MTNIFKHNEINSRQVFTNSSITPARPDETILEKKPLLKRLKPSKHPSKLATFFSQALERFY